MPQLSAAPPRWPAFVNGEDGYACYRIPSLVRMKNGELLAIAEARRDNCGDHGGVIRLVAKISGDNGETWGPLIEIARNVLPDGTEQVAQNPSPASDLLDPAHPDGKIVMLFNKAESGERDVAAGGTVRRYYAIESTDHGRTWQNERDITADVHRPRNPAYTAVYPDAATRYNHPDDWRANFPPVGHGIQLRGGLANDPMTRGRLCFAAYTTIGPRDILAGQCYLIWSDDHGATWRHSDASPVLGANEAMAVEREDGSLLVNFRNYTNDAFTADPVRGQMIWGFDPDGNPIPPATHTEPPELTMPWPGVQGSIERLSWPDDPGGDGVGRILFAGPDSPDKRVGMTVWLSADEGQTWPVRRLMDSGPSAYSDLAILADGQIGLLYELGGENGIMFTRFTLDWLRGD